MKAWWLALQTRERMILIIAGAIVLIALIYLLIVEPVLRKHADLRNQVKAQQKTLAWMQQTSERVKQLQANASQSGSGSVGHQGSLLALMESSSQQSNMRKPIQRMEPEGKNGVKLWLEDADFDNLIHWVGELSYNQGVVVTRATISRGESPGQIDSRLSLQR